MRIKNYHPFFLGLILFFSILSQAIKTEARDPRPDEIPAVQEIAYFLKLNTSHIFSVVANQSSIFSDFRKTAQALEVLSKKADQFHDRTLKSGNAPWRATSAYRELNQAFVDAKAAFIERPIYFLDPRAFEETAFLMGALLQFYVYPPFDSYEESIVYSYPAYAYPRQVYGWIPSFYSFAGIRFTNGNVYPWGRRVLFAPIRR